MEQMSARPLLLKGKGKKESVAICQNVPLTKTLVLWETAQLAV